MRLVHLVGLSGSNGSHFVCVKRVWPGFCIRSHALIMVSGPNQSNKLGVLDSVDGIVSSDLLYRMWLRLWKLIISAQIAHFQKMVLFFVYAYDIYSVKFLSFLTDRWIRHNCHSICTSKDIVICNSKIRPNLCADMPYFHSPSHIFWWIDCTIRVFPSFSSWIRHSCIPQIHRAAITVFISFYIKFKYYFSVITQRGSSNAA